MEEFKTTLRIRQKNQEDYEKQKEEMNKIKKPHF